MREFNQLYNFIKSKERSLWEVYQGSKSEIKEAQWLILYRLLNEIEPIKKYLEVSND